MRAIGLLPSVHLFLCPCILYISLLRNHTSLLLSFSFFDLMGSHGEHQGLTFSESSVLSQNPGLARDLGSTGGERPTEQQGTSQDNHDRSLTRPASRTDRTSPSDNTIQTGGGRNSAQGLTRDAHPLLTGDNPELVARLDQLQREYSALLSSVGPPSNTDRAHPPSTAINPYPGLLSHFHRPGPD